MSVLYLHAAGLISKWGFSDGDVVNDWIFDNLPDARELAPEGALAYLVRVCLMPSLSLWDVELVDIDTSHNPIRAAAVDGVEVDHYSDSVEPFGFEDVEVAVPRDVVLEALRRFDFSG